MTSIAPVAPAPTPASGASKATASGGSDFARVLDSAARDHQGGASAPKSDNAAVTSQDSAGPGTASSGEAAQVSAALADAELAALAALVAESDVMEEPLPADGDALATDVAAPAVETDEADAIAAAITLAATAATTSTETDASDDTVTSTTKPAAAITPSNAAAASGLAGSPSPSTAGPTPPPATTALASTAPDMASPPAVAAASSGVATEGAQVVTATAPPDTASRGANAEPATPVAAPVAPAPAPASAPAAPVQHVSPAQPPAPLATQLSGQLMSLRQLPQGDHVMTLTVNPETFGPVRVVAHISADGLHLELFGASEQARAALRAALPDLRRDLAGAGLDSRLDLGAESHADGRQQSPLGDASDFGQRPGRTAPQGGSPGSATGASAASVSTSRSAHAGAIDVDL